MLIVNRYLIFTEIRRIICRRRQCRWSWCRGGDWSRCPALSLALILVVLEMAVAGRRMMEVIVSVTVTTSHYQPGPGSWDTPTPSWSGYLRCTELQTTKYAVCVHLPGSAVLLYLNTRSNIETKGQMSGPKPEPASGGKRG